MQPLLVHLYLTHPPIPVSSPPPPSFFAGVTNGIDVDGWDPATDKDIAKTYTVDDMAGKVGAALAGRCVHR